MELSLPQCHCKSRCILAKNKIGPGCYGNLELTVSSTLELDGMFIKNTAYMSQTDQFGNIVINLDPSRGLNL